MPGAIGHPREVFGQRPPVQIGGLIADSTAGLVGAMAALAALAARDATGLGQRVDVSRWEAELLANRQSLDFGVNRGRRSARYGPSTSNQVLFPCKDGVIFLTFHRQEQFERLTTLMERPELAADPRFATVEARLANLPAVFDEIAGWLADREGEAVFDLMESRGMIAAYFPTPPQVAASEQVRAIGLFGEVEASSGARLRLPRPLYFSTLQAADKRDGAQAREIPRAPRLSEHTAAVLAEVGQPSSAPPNLRPTRPARRLPCRSKASASSSSPGSSPAPSPRTSSAALAQRSSRWSRRAASIRRDSRTSCPSPAPIPTALTTSPTST